MLRLRFPWRTVRVGSHAVAASLSIIIPRKPPEYAALQHDCFKLNQSVAYMVNNLLQETAFGVKIGRFGATRTSAGRGDRFWVGRT